MSAISTRDRSRTIPEPREVERILPIELPSRTPLWGWALMVVGLMAVMTLGWWVTNSPVFDLRSIEVSGIRHLSHDDVARLGGLEKDTNVLWFSGDEIERRLEEDPWVLRARVTRTLPGDVTVEITERRPVATTPAGGTLFLVAADGMVLGEAGPKVRLPVLVGSFADVTPGRSLPSHWPGLLASSALPPELRGQVRWVSVDTHGTLRLELTDGVVAVYGDATGAQEKGQAVRAVLDWARDHGVRPGLIDVRAPLAPALRPFDQTSPPPGTIPEDPQGPGLIP